MLGKSVEPFIITYNNWSTRMPPVLDLVVHLTCHTFTPQILHTKCLNKCGAKKVRGEMCERRNL